jgi:hypothetical protein
MATSGTTTCSTQALHKRAHRQTHGTWHIAETCSLRCPGHRVEAHAHPRTHAAAPAQQHRPSSGAAVGDRQRCLLPDETSLAIGGDLAGRWRRPLVPGCWLPADRLPADHAAGGPAHPAGRRRTSPVKKGLQRESRNPSIKTQAGGVDLKT